MIGKTLGHYQVTDKLGEGGMGVVYKARDMHLDRFVAIKVLAAEKVADSDRKRRFVQEAKAASALNQPNIIHVYDIDQADGTDFIAMEYVAGKTLDQVIPRKGMRLGEALKYAAQVADALAAAHAAGIVHRDLKPANVMVTDKGLVKVLDFGLAKLTERAESDEFGTTETMDPRTEEGTIVGTVAYMSPEQAEGKKIDRRSDIFSFGSMLYEMLTGQRAFRGDTRASTIASILRDEPKPISEVAGAMPRDVEKLVRRCLQKDVDRRFQHMDDLKVALEELRKESESGVLEADLPAAAKSASLAKYALIAIAAVVLIAACLYWFARQRLAEPDTPLIPVPLTSYPGSEYLPTFSPDGNYVAFQWDPEGPAPKGNIWIKQIGVDPPDRLTSSPEADWGPAWSPDGKFIAFFRATTTGDALMVIPTRGGQEKKLAESDYMSTQAWTPDSQWLVWSQADAAGRGLFLISADTEERRRLTAGENDSDPAISPDGHTLAFTRPTINEPHIYLLHHAEDYIPQGEPEKIAGIAERISYGPAWMPDGSEILFVSRDTSGTFLWRMALRDSAKLRRLALPSGISDAGRFALSRKGDRLAYAEEEGVNSDIWKVEVSNPGKPVQLISSTREERHPAFSPDGKRIAFNSDRSGHAEIWVCDGDGSNSVQLTSFGGPMVLGPRWSPDGQRIAIAASPERNTDIYVVSTGGRVARRLTTDPASDRWPTWSRDGRYIYFTSSRSGSNQIWRMTAGGGEAVQVTPDGEDRDIPQESPDGKSVYYQKGWPSQCSVWRMPVAGGEETRVLDSVDPDGEWTVGDKGIYFATRADGRGRQEIRLYEFATGKTTRIATISGGIGEQVAVSPDGLTILFPQAKSAGTDLMLVENFH